MRPLHNNHIAIVIPSFNESQNLRTLLKEIRRYLPGAGVIIVDDSSEVHAYSGVRVIARRNKLGRGSAVLRGLAEALQDKNIAYCFEMDADLSHSPAEFEKFLAVRNKADLIIGSRYLAGSDIIKWPWYRLIQSKMINAFLRVWLGLPLTDFTNGFRLYSRRAAVCLVHAHLRESGFIALSEMAYTLQKKGFRITEIATSFSDREFGHSSANTKELVMSFIGALRIRLCYNYYHGKSKD